MTDRYLAWKILNRQFAELHYITNHLKYKLKQNKITDKEHEDLRKLEEIRIPELNRVRIEFEQEILGEFIKNPVNVW